MIWTDWLLLISFNTAAKEVVLPLPVAPVTRTMPFFSLAILSKASGRLKSFIVGIRDSIFLMTME